MTDDEISDREAKVRKLLGEAFKGVPFVRYRRRDAATAAEYFSDVEHGVSGPGEAAARVIRKRKK